MANACDHRAIAGAICGLSVFLLASAPSPAETTGTSVRSRIVRLCDLPLVDARQDYGTLGLNRSVTGKPLKIGTRVFEHGLGTHASSVLTFDLAGEFERFESWVGVDAAMIPHKMGSIELIVYGDGRELFRSGVMHETDAARHLEVGVAGVQELKLAVTDAGDGISGDNADWAEAVLLPVARTREPEKTARYTVTAPGISVGLTADGNVAEVKGSSSRSVFSGQTRLLGCKLENQPVATELAGGGVSVSRTLVSTDGHACKLTDRFSPMKDSIRWDVEITGDGSSWSVPVVTSLSCARPRETRFWTGWSDPERDSTTWHDPLVPTRLNGGYWHYGNAAQTAPVGGDFISIPLVTLIPDCNDSAVSLIVSPEEVLLDMTLAVSAAGNVRLARTCHRLGAGQTARFAMDLVGHEVDWRGGLRWMTARYPAFFNPPNPKVDTMAGCGAYSGNENPIDVEKFRKMAFRINWKLSDDFPYMGMFIPPVKDADQRWTRSCDEPAPPGKGDTISCRQMNDYAKYMKDNGFFVLNYFNVTEFGKNMKDKEVGASQVNDQDLWKDPLAFIKLRAPNGYLRPPMLTCYNAWVVDVGDPGYRAFMLEQARRHIELLPDTFGICIDRMDWLRYYNPNADDGVSWRDGKPARSLYRSWLAFMAELGPLMHKADKVILGNTMTMRLELNSELDGIYTEHGDNPGALNAAALMGIRKPVLAWTYNKTLREPDPDSFFQRHLYLGVFPTAPYPTNHHCTVPDEWTDKQFLDYGPLLDTIRGRKWDLAPHRVECTSPGVKVNLFEVPDGYVIPVTFGGKTEAATIQLRGIPGLDRFRCEALHPSADTPVNLPTTTVNGQLELNVPLKRGCAMVRLVKPANPSN